jgi:periplasmic protein TonB
MLIRIILPLTIANVIFFLSAQKSATDQMYLSQNELETQVNILAVNDSLQDTSLNDTALMSYPVGIVEEEPVFQGGGVENFIQYVQENLKYPDVAQECSIAGHVIVKFIVDKEGCVKNVEILRGVDPGLDKEAIRVVSSSPRWEPGMEKGNPVDVQVIIPVKFVLN